MKADGRRRQASNSQVLWDLVSRFPRTIAFLLVAICAFAPSMLGDLASARVHQTLASLSLGAWTLGAVYIAFGLVIALPLALAGRSRRLWRAWCWTAPWQDLGFAGARYQPVRLARMAGLCRPGSYPPVGSVRVKRGGTTQEWSMSFSWRAALKPSSRAELERVMRRLCDSNGSARWQLIGPTKGWWTAQFFDADKLDATAARIERPANVGPVSLAAVPLGVGADGDLISVPLTGYHWLICGQSGAGKGSVMWNMAAGCCAAAEPVQLYGIDLAGGVELSVGCQIFDRVATNPKEVLPLIERLDGLVEERLSAMRRSGVRNHVPTVEEPAVVVVIDEAASLKTDLERNDYEKVRASLLSILRRARKCSIVVLAFTQNTTKDSFELRDAFTRQIALRLRPGEPELLFGRPMIEAGARADTLDPTKPGTGYLLDFEGGSAVRKFRAWWVGDEAVRALRNRWKGGHCEPPA